MDVKKSKYVFIVLSALLLVFMLLMSRSAGVNCDEVLHYKHSVAVFNYFASHGKDTAALNTPVSHLQYYGQSYDNITTILIRWFRIDDVYGLRHIMSTLAGWLTILVTAIFAVWLAGYEAGIIVLLLFAVSPTFLGHAQNNLKDVPFALAYISGTFFSIRLLSSRAKSSLADVMLLTLSIAFCISIRPGGLILICFLYLFFAVYYIIRFYRDGKVILPEAVKKLLIITAISVAAYFLGIILWPFALQDPLRNPFISYNVMVHYPDTFRQIFEGKAEWSDFMPWYYLPKSMIITIPLVVSLGFAMFMMFSLYFARNGKRIFLIFLSATILLPLLFVIISRSNLYSSWRHFLFVYPAIVLLAAVSFADIFTSIEKRLRKLTFVVAIILASLHPLVFILTDTPYSYLYYNQLVGGLKGAYGNYETDYYFVNQREASEWLLKYFDENKITGPVTVGSNFSAEWFFRSRPEIRNIYFRNEERSMYDWDYYIVTNRYISPWQLKNRIWPPADALKIIYAGDVPVAAVVKRKSKVDYKGYMALTEQRNSEAVNFFSAAIKIDSCDEVIFYNFAVALNRLGEYKKADSVLNQCLKLNPDFELALMYLGNIAAERGDKETARSYYKKVISVNRKYDDAYEALKKIDEKNKD
jgi:tetratricopeptide (TPR) repeat protein